ncbi:hypothetical protein [Pseudomonas syringae]|uniref:hypothetical protein n=2 Tax=Pseudomonas TaxID=286 RepID=UPI000EFCEAF0|nr:hypothetical protein [Pseudomonas syringae]
MHQEAQDIEAPAVKLWQLITLSCVRLIRCDVLGAEIMREHLMGLKAFEQPVNRIGFVLFCLSLSACTLAFLVTYRTRFDLGIMWFGHLLMDSGNYWQQSVFKAGLLGAIVGAALAWNLMAYFRKLAVWVSKG